MGLIFPSLEQQPNRSLQKFSSLVYTPISAAIRELERRRNDQDLSNRIWKYLNGDIPSPLLKEPKAVLFRQIITPNHELKEFMEMADSRNISPLFFEYHQDKFVSCNPLKHALGKLSFYKANEGRAPKKVSSLTVIDFNKSDGKEINTIKTIWGKNLIEFHHSLFNLYYQKYPSSFFEASEWFRRGGLKATQYYDRYMTLFLQHAILFENFILDSSELHFVENVFLPSFNRIQSEFGVKPLIVKLLPMETQADQYWLSYPAEILSSIKEENKL